MLRLPPRSTRTDTLFPYTTLFRSPLMSGVHINHSLTEPLALYIHWPFCVSKCPYCDFNSHVREAVDQQQWRDALLADMAPEAGLANGRLLSSRSEEHTSALQSLMPHPYAVFFLQKNNIINN